MLDYINAEVPKKEQLINNRENSLDSIGEKIIPLLEERVIIDYKKQKLGEIVVKKQIETRNIQVAVRREKLIVEQVGDESKLLAEIDLDGGDSYSVDWMTHRELKDIEGNLTATGEFNSPEIVSLLLNAIALDTDHGCQRVKVELTLQNPLQQKKCQEWINRFSQM